MMTQPEYWVLFWRWKALGNKDDEGIISAAELHEMEDIRKRIKTAYLARPTLYHCCYDGKLTP